MVPAALALAREALGGMLMTRIKVAAAGFMVLGVVGLGAGRLPALAQDGPTAKAAKPGTPPAPPVSGAVDYDKLIADAVIAIGKHEAEVESAKKRLVELTDQLEATRKRSLQAKEIRSRLSAVPPTPASPAERVEDRFRRQDGLRRAGDTPPPAIEGRKRVLPDYVVEPPDLLLVEVVEALPGRPITGEHLVRPDGKMSLNYYGEIDVAGLTTAQVKEKVVLHLRKHLTDEALGLVRREGDRVLSIDPKDSNRVSVDVTAYNSKVYYVQGDVATPGRIPVTGSETVLDAINFAGGVLPGAKSIRVVRPGPAGTRDEQVLPVDLDAIVKRGDPTTNYQLLPGDRILVERAEPSPRAGEKADARQDQVEKRLDAMIRELEALRRELREAH
jgi:protein involved in polysaccharide export with SLBB domain